METKELQKYDEKNYNLLVRPEDLRASPLLNVEIIPVRIDSRDVRQGGEIHNIGGMLVPSRSALDKIADATGISFDEEHCGTRKEGKDTWVGKAVGRRKNPDGTYRTGVAEYEFDIAVRAKELKSERDVLQLQKFARQRADTGARLRVIRELTGLKTGFTAEELQKPFVFVRYTVNVEAIMKDPDMKKAALNQALGVSQEIYGPATVRDVTPEELPAPEEQQEAEEPEDPDPFDEHKDAELSEEAKVRIELEEWLLADIKASAKQLIRAALDAEGTTVEALRDLVKRCKAYEERKTQGVAK